MLKAGEVIQGSVLPQMVDFGSQQGLSDFEANAAAVTAIVGYVEDFKKAKTPLRAERCCL